ncbi:MAG: glucose 1-dehydrogenase [Dehalococcoidia bacterium]|nr:glucose 1-dehydrogenase [Dehalococcoidia bacterium]
MDIRFDDKVAIVTGAARGIGFACAEILADSGAKVALVDILGERLAESTKKIQKKGTAKGYQLDLTKVSTIGPTVSRIRQELGEIDVLIQAAAIGPARQAEEITEAEWDAVLDTNTKGLFFCMQAVTGQSMIPRKAGSIVNFASIAGLVGMRPPLCAAHYHASKGGVVQLTRQGAIEWAPHNIRVNAVAPGGVLTEMTMKMIGTPEKMAAAVAGVPLKRLSEPEDIAAAVCFLASDAARMITGHILVVDGGGYAAGS